MPNALFEILSKVLVCGRLLDKSEPSSSNKVEGGGVSKYFKNKNVINIKLGMKFKYKKNMLTF